MNPWTTVDALVAAVVTFVVVFLARFLFGLARLVSRRH